jgi:hypothetical protein
MNRVKYDVIVKTYSGVYVASDTYDTLSDAKTACYRWSIQGAYDVEIKRFVNGVEKPYVNSHKGKIAL